MSKIYEKLKLEFPKKKSIPVEHLGQFSQLWYGREKIGKTTLAQHFPDPLFLMFERGGKALALNQRRVQTWREFCGWIQMLEDNPDSFKTVVVDTVDRLYKLCQKYICAQTGIQHPHDANDYGATYDKISREFFSWMERACEMDRGVIFISHTTEQKITREQMEDTTRLIPTLDRRGREVLEPMVDIWAFYEYDQNGRRIMNVVGDDLRACGHRCEGHFLGLKRIPMGRSSREAYANFCAAFNNELEVPKPKTAKFLKSK